MEGSVDNDALRHDVAEIMSLVQDQLRDLSPIRHEQSELAATVKAADGSVEVTVDAQGVVTGILDDESYLEEFELTELGGHITGAVREAAQQVNRQAAALLAPAAERRGAIRALSGIAFDLPEVGCCLV
jgi:DNA-binding protein YbaB